MSRAATRRPQLTLDELQQLKWLLGGGLTLLAVGTVFYMDVEAWTLMGLTALTTLATFFWPTLPARVPSLVHTLAFPAIVAFFAADLWLKTEVLPAMVRLDILLLLYRSLSYRQRRDDLQIIVLGLFLIVVAGVLTVSLAFAAQILVYTGCALALLLVVTLSDAVRGSAQAAPVPFGETPGWAERANWRQLVRRLCEVLDWRVVGLGVILFAGVVGVSALLFLAIPRFQLENTMFLDRIISKKAKSGFSDTIRIGEVTEIQQDNGVALSVDVSNQAQIPAAPYWRMLVLDSYENGTFKFSRELKAEGLEGERTAAALGGHARGRTGDAARWTFYLESGVSRYLPILGHFEVLQFHEAQHFRFGRRLAVVALREEPVSMTAYRVEGFDLSPTLSDPRFAALWKARDAKSERLPTLQAALPAFPHEPDLLNLRRALAASTGGTTLPAGEFVRSVSAWLKTRHAYSLSPSIPIGGGDPLVRWVTSREPGHCELFAGSFVLLARAAGFPARVVTGFRGGTWNGYSNNFTIRNADAHAWAELFDEETGAWLRADPLAVAGATQAGAAQGAAAIASRLDRSWKARLDSLRVFWYRRIVNFDQRSQAEALKAVKEATQNSGRRFREAMENVASSVKVWISAPWDFRRVMSATGLLALFAAAIWIWREFGRGWWGALRHGHGAHRDDPVRHEAGRWLRRMAEAGNRGPETGNRRPNPHGVVAELQRLRFGARPTWPPHEKVFRRARQALRAARRERVTRP